MSEKPPVLNHVEATRRFRESGQTLQVYFYLHMRAGSSLEQIAAALELSPEAALDSLRDLHWGGWILTDEDYGYWPVPMPLAPFVFVHRMISRV